MTTIADPPVKFDPARTYTFDEFSLLNDWLKTHTLVVENEPISHFEFDSKGRLIPMTRTPIRKEAVVAEIVGQLANWNIQSRINGSVATSQGGFNISRTGGGNIRALDTASTPWETYNGLHNARSTSPEEILSIQPLSSRSKTGYVPAEVELGRFVDTINKEIYIFKP